MMGLKQIISLETDQPGKMIGDHFEKKSDLNIVRVNTPDKVLHDKKEINQLIEEKIGYIGEEKLVVYGSGRYHHYTYGLCKLADRISNDYGYIHFDHHNDYANAYWR